MGMFEEEWKKWENGTFLFLQLGEDVASKGSNMFGSPLFIFQLGCKASIWRNLLGFNHHEVLLVVWALFAIDQGHSQWVDFYLGSHFFF